MKRPGANPFFIFDMKTEIRHRRLYAFYNSKVLNALVITIIVCLLLMAYMRTTLLPAVCSGVALLYFIVYSLWFWIKKPKSIVINTWLSSISGWFVLYFLIIAPMKAANPWWYITPIVCAITALFISLLTRHDQSFII